MHGRILFGVVAWLLGAATATAGSLLAVSLLGQGITGATGPLLSQVAVDRALATEAAEPATGAANSGTAGAASPGATRATASGAGGPSAGGPSSDAASSGTASPAGGPSAGASPPGAPSGTPAATPSAGSDGGTVLASRGGDVVASCQAAGAYLDSWSPAQGFVAGDVRRGPAQAARVTFDPASGSSVSAVTMVVSCSAGVPSATTHTWTGDE